MSPRHVIHPSNFPDIPYVHLTSNHSCVCPAEIILLKKAKMSDILIVGASRGLGASLVKKYASRTKGTVYATSRSEPTSEPVKNVRNIPGVDLTSKDAGSNLASALKQHGAQIGAVIITAGYFGTETFDKPNWEDEIKM